MNNKTNIEEDIENIYDLLQWADDNNTDVTKECKSFENILADRERLEIALFMLIRNSKVLPTGLKLNKSKKEINQMSYNTMRELLTMINFKEAEKMYEEGKSSECV